MNPIAIFTAPKTKELLKTPIKGCKGYDD